MFSSIVVHMRTNMEAPVSNLKINRDAFCILNAYKDIIGICWDHLNLSFLQIVYKFIVQVVLSCNSLFV